MAGESFYDVLTEAVSDMVTNGYDDARRVSYWQERLREAAERMLASAAEIEQMLRDNLAGVYARLIDSGVILQQHPGVSKFTLEMIRPALRNELDKRILASADLIKLNRQQAIEQTLRRFSGWGTSIPEGGMKGAQKRAEKTRIRKAMAQLPFETRRVLTDQGHKLTASINEVIATGGGAIAVEWRSHYRQPGYNYRPDHKERDSKVYLMKDCWAVREGLVKPGPAGYYQNITAFAQEPFCRCYGIWIYTLGALPAEMLTANGREVLAKGRERREAMATA